MIKICWQVADTDIVIVEAWTSCAFVTRNTDITGSVAVNVRTDPERVVVPVVARLPKLVDSAIRKSKRGPKSITDPDFFMPGEATDTNDDRVLAVAVPYTMFPPDCRAPEVKFKRPPTTRSLRRPVVSFGALEPTEYDVRFASPPTASRPSTSDEGADQEPNTKALYCAITGSFVNAQLVGVEQVVPVQPIEQTQNPSESQTPWSEQSALHVHAADA